MATIKITKANFTEEVMNSTVPVLVDFWAPWCGPCKMIGPVLEEVSNEATDAKICKVNVDEEGELAAKFQVMSIPTLILFKDGQVVESAVGAKSKAELLKMLGH
ncbi:MAG: thioredoxin [Eubacteriales bacterium]